MQDSPDPSGKKTREIELKYESGESETKRARVAAPQLGREELNFSLGLIEGAVPELERIGPGLWSQRASGETLSLEDVLERYWEDLPLGKAKSKWSKSTPDWLEDVRRQIPVRLIETDRLYARSASLRRTSANWGRFAQTSDLPGVLTVNRYSRELGETIRQTLTKYGELSQSLDRTFPARVVHEQQPSVSLGEFRKELSEIETRRANLVSAGLLAQETDYWPVTISEQVDRTKIGLLSVYVRDAKEKLKVFDEILAKVELFKEIINARFLDKRLAVSPSGFAVEAAHGDTLPLNLLSSGEQHELVLFYELLFNVTENSLILIDEPEISLHVAWQEAFLEDLGRVAGISKFDAVVATHSPEIINTHWDLAVELKALNGKVGAKTESSSHRERRAPQASS